MKLARWMAGDGQVVVGAASGTTLVPLAIADPARPDEAIIDIAMTRGEKYPQLGEEVSLGAVRLLPPVVRPGMLRDFSTFESHARSARKHLNNQELPDEWYGTPVGYFSNPNRIYASGDLVPSPVTTELDFELEVAAVVGRDCSDVSPEQAVGAIAGYTIWNDWSARDIQREERKLGSGGPTKCKDFANTLGAFLVTPDELRGEPGAPVGLMTAHVNGRPYSRDDLDGMRFKFTELISYTARSSLVRRGDAIGSGTCGTGCLAELVVTHGADAYPWLKPGDIVELFVEGIGIQFNMIGPVTGKSA